MSSTKPCIPFSFYTSAETLHSTTVLTKRMLTICTVIKSMNDWFFSNRLHCLDSLKELQIPCTGIHKFQSMELLIPVLFLYIFNTAKLSIQNKWQTYKFDKSYANKMIKPVIFLYKYALVQQLTHGLCMDLKLCWHKLNLPSRIREIFTEQGVLYLACLLYANKANVT